MPEQPVHIVGKTMNVSRSIFFMGLPLTGGINILHLPQKKYIYILMVSSGYSGKKNK